MDISPAEYLAWKRRNGMAVGAEDDPDNQTVGVRMLFGEPGQGQPNPKAVYGDSGSATLNGGRGDDRVATLHHGPVPPLPVAASRPVRANPKATAARWLPRDLGAPKVDRIDGPIPFPTYAKPGLDQLGRGDILHPDYGPGLPPPLGTAKPAPNVMDEFRDHVLWPADDIGELSRAKEGPNGLATVSTGKLKSGKADAGGISYGPYQFATRWRTPEDFVATDGSAWKPRLGTLQPGTPEYGDTWEAIAKESPADFRFAQERYIRRAYYQPQADVIRKNTGMDVSGHSRALHNVILSTAIQHGPRRGLISEAINELRRSHSGQEPSDSEMIDAIYAKRAEWYPGDAGRYRAERQLAQEMLAREAK